MEWSIAWPETEDDLVRVQQRLAQDAAEALAAAPWHMTAKALVGGCFVAHERPAAGLGSPPSGGGRGWGPARGGEAAGTEPAAGLGCPPGAAGHRAWAAAVAWRLPSVGSGNAGRVRRSDHVLRGSTSGRGPRRSSDVAGQVVVMDRVRAAYRPGFLALRDGPVLRRAVAALEPVPDVLVVDATGLDHPRGAGLAVHLGAVAGLPTVGVTHRPLLAVGELPPLQRGASAPVRLEGRTVGRWLCTRSGARPVVVHAGWRTDPATALDLVLAASTPGARTPVPLQEARRVAREARALGSGAAKWGEQAPSGGRLCTG